MVGGAISILLISEYNEDRKHLLASLSEQNDFFIAGIGKDIADTLIKVMELKPNVLIIDLQPKGIDGPELACIIRRRSPATVVILLSDRDEVEYAQQAFSAGITGFLLKKIDLNNLASIIRIVSSGGCFYSTSIFSRVFSSGRFGQFSDKQTWNCLGFSPAERGIVNDIAMGFSDEEIAKRMNYSPGSIKNCLTMIKRKTKLKNRIQIVLFSLIHGLINEEQLDIYKNNRQFFKDTIQ